jgi:hypothetical protein
MAKGDREIKKQKEASVAAYLQERSLEVLGSDGARKNRVVTTTAGRERLFLDQFQEVLGEVFKDKLAMPKALPKKAKSKTERVIHVVLSDTHYGSALDPREVGHRFGSVEEARRTAAICRQVAQYKQHYRDETELNVHLLGDIIQGQLHDMRDGLPLAEQVASAMRILVQAIRFFSVEFPRGVKVFCTPGNHGRNTARHRDRATNQKWDSIETMVYSGLKEASALLPNVEVVLGYEPKYDFEVFGDLGFGTHGDTVINPGYPGRNIDVAGMKKQIDSINNARAVKGQKPYKLFLMGHVHVGTITHLPGGVIIVTNGCLLPPDSYAQSIGIFNTACGQWMFESVKGHIVGDARFVTVDEETDKDASLDAIIKPFAGL